MQRRAICRRSRAACSISDPGGQLPEAVERRSCAAAAARRRPPGAGAGPGRRRGAPRCGRRRPPGSGRSPWRCRRPGSRRSASAAACLVPGVEQRRQPGEVVVERRLQGVVEQVLDGERLGEVGAGGLAGARSGCAGRPRLRRTTTASPFSAGM